MRDLVREDLARKRLGRAVGAFEHDDAEVAERAVEHASEGIGHADARRVGASQIVEKFGREFGLRQRRRKLVEGGVNFAADLDRADRRVPGAWRRRHRDRAALQLVVEHRDGRDFVPVVILGFDPEHGDRRHAVFLRDPRGELRGRQSFVEREQRTAEQSGLLAGDDRDGIRIGEARRGLASGRRRVAPLELRREERAQLGALTRMALRVRDCGGPRGGRGRVAGKKRRQR